MPPLARITQLAFFIYVPLCGFALAWAWVADGRFAWSRNTQWLSAAYAPRFALSLTMGLTLAIIVIRTTPLLVERTQWARALHQELKELIEPLSPMEIWGLALASGFAEELFFRGAMQPVLGLVTTSLIFGAVHVGPRRVFLAWGVWAFVMGMLFGAIFDLTGVLWGPVFAHVWINARNLTFVQRH